MDLLSNTTIRLRETLLEVQNSRKLVSLLHPSIFSRTKRQGPLDYIMNSIGISISLYYFYTVTYKIYYMTYHS